MSMHGLKCKLLSPVIDSQDEMTLTEIMIPLEIVEIPDGLSCLVLNPETQECIGGGFFQKNVVTFAAPIHVTSRQPVELMWDMELDDDEEDAEIA